MSLPAWVVPLLQCPACRRGAFRDGDHSAQCDRCGWQLSTDSTPILAPQGPASWIPKFDRTLRQTEEQIALIERRGWIGDPMIASLPPGTVVLSVGEGWGEMLVRLATRNVDCYFVGTDLSADRIRKASELADTRGLKNVWFCVADATNLPFAAGAFEAGFTRGVLHILPEPLPALAELRRVLRARLLVDRLANRPFFSVWFFLLQQYENVRAVLQGRPADPGIWEGVVETLATGGTYWPLWRYREWFRQDRHATVYATSFLIWERASHLPVLGWLGTGGAIDVRF